MQVTTCSALVIQVFYVNVSYHCTSGVSLQNLLNLNLLDIGGHLGKEGL